MRNGIGGSQAEASGWLKPGEASGRGAWGCSGEGRAVMALSPWLFADARCTPLVMHPSGEHPPSP